VYCLQDVLEIVVLCLVNIKEKNLGRSNPGRNIIHDKLWTWILNSRQMKSLNQGKWKKFNHGSHFGFVCTDNMANFGLYA